MILAIWAGLLALSVFAWSEHRAERNAKRELDEAQEQLQRYLEAVRAAEGGVQA